MPNPYFQFKQFIIHQENCEMKVCTDACILGAWFAQKIPFRSKILDLGSGTGLLMLMLAQKNESDIEGIELDLLSFRQLKENISQSKWSGRLHAFPGDARFYSFPVKYNFIISNPPFFEEDLLSPSVRKNIAKHSRELNLEDLIKILGANLETTGSFGILLSFHRSAYFENLANQHHFYVIERLSVRQTPRHDYFRSILHFARNQPQFVPESELTIQDEAGKYTDEFTELMKDYYLNL